MLCLVEYRRIDSSTALEQKQKIAENAYTKRATPADSDVALSSMKSTLGRRTLWQVLDTKDDRRPFKHENDNK